MPRSPIATMKAQIVVTGALFLLGSVAFMHAVRHERLMHRYRHPEVSYQAATFRTDGGWQRSDLFTPMGLLHQRRASSYGLTGVVLWIAALAVWVAMGWR